MSDESEASAGKGWSPEEISWVVSDYFAMLRLELIGKSYNKSEHRRFVQQVIRRTDASIEMKRQNISAVLDILGLPRIDGYKPLPNFQQALLDEIEDYLSKNGLPTFELQKKEGFEERPSIFIGLPPPITPRQVSKQIDLSRLLRKFDPATRDAQNRELGMLGEERALENEISNLWNLGRQDLSKKVRHVSKEDGDGLGYDIHSFDPNGDDRLIEVKTTTGTVTTPFFITENERLVSIDRQSHYRLLRLYDFSKSPKAFELSPPLENFVSLRPTVYQASFS